MRFPNPCYLLLARRLKFAPVAFLACLLLSYKSSAHTDDFGLWLNVTVNHKITRNLSASIEEQLRLDQNAMHGGQFFTEAGASYGLSKKFRVALYYRFINSNQENFFSKRHRLFLDLNFKTRYRSLEILLRSRVQSQVRDVHSSENGKIPSWHSRNKLTVKLRQDKKYLPYISTEMYYRLKSPGEISNRIDKTRFAAGMEYEFNRIHTLDLYYMLQTEHHTNNPIRDFVVGVGYILTF